LTEIERPLPPLMREASPEAGRQVGMRDVASRAGVSIATVSRFINDPATLSPDMRTRVEDAVRALGYIRHGAARALSMRRSHAIGAIIPTVDNPTRASKVAALQKHCREHGYNLLLALSEYDLDLELQQCRNLVEAGVDGLMLEGGLHHPELYELLESRNIAFVNTIVYDPASPHPNIGFDNRGMARKLAEYLLHLGHTEFGVISGPRGSNDRARERVEGVHQALAKKGLPLPAERVVERPYRVAEGRLGLKTLMELPSPPTAVICGNDYLAAGAMRALISRGLRIPEDVSVVGFDDIRFSRYTSPPLTTVSQPKNALGREAMTMLIEILNDPEVPPRKRVLSAELVVRGSTGPRLNR